MEGFTTEEDQELLSRIEKQIKRRFIIGSQVSEHAIIQDFTRQVSLENQIDFLMGLDYYWSSADLHIILDTILVQIRTALNKDLIKRITSAF